MKAPPGMVFLMFLDALIIGEKMVKSKIALLADKP